MTEVDAKDRTPGPGEWWWAYVAGKPEPVWLVRPAPAVPGKWEVDAAGISTLVVAAPLEPVVPYVPAAAPARSPRYDPRPGDTKTWSTSNAWGPYTVQVVGVQPRGDVEVEYTGEDAVFGRFTLDAAMWADDRGGTARWTAG